MGNDNGSKIKTMGKILGGIGGASAILGMLFTTLNARISDVNAKININTKDTRQILRDIKKEMREDLKALKKDVREDLKEIKTVLNRFIRTN